MLCLCHQRIRATVNTLEQKRLLMDLDISMRTVDCFFTVTFYGALFREVKPVFLCGCSGGGAFLRFSPYFWLILFFRAMFGSAWS